MKALPEYGGCFILLLKNGQVLVYNLRTRKIIFSTEVAHAAQVQKVAISPYDH
jgi:hypothetical protein